LAATRRAKSSRPRRACIHPGAAISIEQTDKMITTRFGRADRMDGRYQLRREPIEGIGAVAPAAFCFMMGRRSMIPTWSVRRAISSCRA
jgi:hypothetical protein